MKILKTTDLRLRLRDPVTGESFELTEADGVIIGPVCVLEQPSDLVELKLLAKALVDAKLGRGKS